MNFTDPVTSPERSDGSSASDLRSDLDILELMPVSVDMTPEEVVSDLDIGCFLTMTGRSYPADLRCVLDQLEENDLVHRSTAGCYSITLLGAILFGRDLTGYERLMCKTIRVVKYIGMGKAEIERQIELRKGYAVEWEQLLNCVDLMLPSREEIRGAFMIPIRAYPPDTVRDVILHAMSHQDLSDRYHGILVEIFDDRLIVSYPSRSERGESAYPTNGVLAGMMRSAGMCGTDCTGLDWVFRACESMNLSTPEVRIGPSFTRVTLFGGEPSDSYTPVRVSHDLRTNP